MHEGLEVDKHVPAAAMRTACRISRDAKRPTSCAALRWPLDQTAVGEKPGLAAERHWRASSAGAG